MPWAQSRRGGCQSWDARGGNRLFTLSLYRWLTTLLDLSFPLPGNNAVNAFWGCNFMTCRLSLLPAVLLAAISTLATIAPGLAEGARPNWRFAPPPGVTVTDKTPRHALALQGNPYVSPVYLRQVVPYATTERSGTIVVDTRQHFLYFVLGDGRALRYGIGVARDGFEWSGTHRVTRKAEWPSWTPPAEMRRRQPGLPTRMEGGPNNPLGARALYLGSTLYRIHGTTEPWSIGQNVSSGCIRMTNADVIDLYGRVQLNTKVVVLS